MGSPSGTSRSLQDPTRSQEKIPWESSRCRGEQTLGRGQPGSSPHSATHQLPLCSSTCDKDRGSVHTEGRWGRVLGGPCGRFLGARGAHLSDPRLLRWETQLSRPGSDSRDKGGRSPWQRKGAAWGLAAGFVKVVRSVDTAGGGRWVSRWFPPFTGPHAASSSCRAPGPLCSLVPGLGVVPGG